MNTIAEQNAVHARRVALFFAIGLHVALAIGLFLASTEKPRPAVSTVAMEHQRPATQAGAVRIP